MDVKSLPMQFNFSMDGVQKANSGHLELHGMADMAESFSDG